MLSILHVLTPNLIRQRPINICSQCVLKYAYSQSCKKLRPSPSWFIHVVWMNGNCSHLKRNYLKHHDHRKLNWTTWYVPMVHSARVMHTYRLHVRVYVKIKSKVPIQKLLLYICNQTQPLLPHTSQKKCLEGCTYSTIQINTHPTTKHCTKIQPLHIDKFETS